MAFTAADRARTSERNWSGNYEYLGRVVAPSSVNQIRELIRSAGKVGFLGSRHSFNAIADSGVLIDMRALPRSIDVDSGGRVARVSGAMTYGDVALALDSHGMALANFASLPHITVAGAIATGTHGSGVANASLGTSVTALEIIRADGETVEVTRASGDFAGYVVGLGALGAVTAVTLEIEPAYQVRQSVIQNVPWSSLVGDLRAVMSSAYSVSLFTRWDGSVRQAWLKERVSASESRPHGAFADGQPAQEDLHPVGDLDPVNCTPQMGREGPSFDRLPHFRMNFTPSDGDELQSEFLLDWAVAAEAIEALSAIGDRIRPALIVCEVRAVAGDDQWMSPAYGRDSIAVHFTWRQQPRDVAAALELIEGVLLPLGARPHWGKVFLAQRDDIAPRYPKLADFLALAERCDPGHVFRNDWLERHVFGG
jgi:xylitol oxidase